MRVHVLCVSAANSCHLHNGNCLEDEGARIQDYVIVCNVRLKSFCASKWWPF